MLCQNISATSGELPTTDASIVHHSLSHKSVDHHLSLGIFHVPGNPTPYVYSTPSKTNDVMSQGTPDLGNDGTDKKEQPTPQDVTPTIVNTLTWPSPLPIPLLSRSPPTMFTPSMAAPTSPRFTNSSRTLPTCSPMSTSPPQATDHWVHSLQTTMNGQWSTHLLRRNGSTSRPSRRLSIIDSNDSKLKELYNESRLIHDGTWGTLTWGPPPPWAITKQQPLQIPAPNPPLAKEANGFED